MKDDPFGLNSPFDFELNDPGAEQPSDSQEAELTSPFDMSTDVPFHYAGWDVPEVQPMLTDDIGPDNQAGALRSGEWSPGRFDWEATPEQSQRGLISDYEAARKTSFSSRSNPNESWSLDIPSTRPPAVERLAHDDELFGRTYDQSRQVGMPALAGVKRMPKRWLENYHRTDRCRRCDGPRDGDRCNECAITFCPGCSAALENGEKCHNPQCQEYVPLDCDACNKWPCECER